MMPATSYSKMFKTESCLVASSIEHCKTLTSQAEQLEGSTVVLQEVDMGFGIADIVVIAYKDYSHNSLPLFLSKNDVLVYKLVERKKRLAINDIIKITRLSKQQVYCSIERLDSSAYILRLDDQVVEILNVYRSNISSTIAIEAKLKNWKRALHQAYRYKWFAAKSYVLLDKANLGPAVKNLVEFQLMGVGLLSLDMQGNLDMVFDPSLDKPIDEKMEMLLNEKVREQLHGTTCATMKLKKSSKRLSDNCCFHQSSEYHD